jgi:hypothetical protein
VIKAGGADAAEGEGEPAEGGTTEGAGSGRTPESHAPTSATAAINATHRTTESEYVKESGTVRRAA